MHKNMQKKLLSLFGWLAYFVAAYGLTLAAFSPQGFKASLLSGRTWVLSLILSVLAVIGNCFVSR